MCRSRQTLKQQRLRMGHGVLDVKMTFDETPCLSAATPEKFTCAECASVHKGSVVFTPPVGHGESSLLVIEIFATCSARCLPPLIC